MAESDKEDIPERVEEEGSDAGSGKKGLSTSLLIKIAIGLAVLLIVLAGALFFVKSSDQTSSADNSESDNAQQTVEESEVTASDQPETSATVSDVNTTTNTPANTSTSERALAQILELQQQISDLKVENQNLNKNISTLTNENNDLKKEVEVFTTEINSTEIPLDQLVNTQDLPRDYRRETYANSPKFELEPKWGEFENTTKNNE